VNSDSEFGDVGLRIRSLRRARDFTLEQLSEQTGLSISYLSQIENGHANINLRILRDLAQALGVPMIDFLVTDEQPDVYVVRVSDRRSYLLKSGSTESLLYAQQRPNLEATLMDLPPGTSSGAPNSHPGEEFTYVLKGRIRIGIGENRTFDLNAGDIIYYRSSYPHWWENPFDTHAQALITNTPATF